MTDPRTPEHDPRLRDAIARLPDELPPARDLWPAIRAEVEAERVLELPLPATTAPAGRRSARHWPTLAVAASLLIVASVGVTWQLMRADETVATPNAGAPSSAGSPSLARFAQYERTAAELRAALDLRADQLDPSTREVLERSLRTIDEALLEARAALELDPSSAAIRTYVESAYRHKLDFLRRANDVAALRGS